MYGISVGPSGGSLRKKMSGNSPSYAGSEKNANSISTGRPARNGNSISYGRPKKNGNSIISSRRPNNSISSGESANNAGRTARNGNSFISFGRSERKDNSFSIGFLDKSKPIYPIAFVSAGFIMPNLLPISNQSLEEMIKDASERKKKVLDQLKSVAVRGRYSGKGLNIMVSQGFQLGTGLGRNCQGILVPVERNFHQNTIGLGFEDHSQKYLQPTPHDTTDRKMQVWKPKKNLEEELCTQLAQLDLQ